MKNLRKLVNRAIAECEAVGIETGIVIHVEANTRAKSRWGQCCQIARGAFSINVNIKLLEDSVSDEATMNTVVHEVLHTCKGCQNHGALWQAYADKMNRKYGYNIKRTTSQSEKGVALDRHPRTVKFIIQCDNCGGRHGYQRDSKVVKLIRAYGYNSGCRCSCGSNKLRLIKEG